MKIPEKVYIDDFGSGFSHGWHTEHSYEKDIEYVRKDVFIKKADEFIGTFFHPDDTELIDTILNRFHEHMKLK